MEVDDQKPTGVPDGWEVVQPAAAAAPSALPDVSAHAGRPAAGRGTQLDPDKSMRGLEVATTPLAHPTGVEAIDSFTSPVGIASLAAGGAGIVRAGVAGGVGAAVKTAVAEASPVLKFEVVRSSLVSLGVSPGLAGVAAAIASGYSGKGKGKAAAAEVVPEGPHMDRSVAVPAGSLTQEQLAQRVRFGSGTPPPRPGKQPPIAAVAPPEPIVPAAPPDSSILSADAVAERRSVGAAAAKPSLTAAESKEYLKLRAAGKTDAQAKTVIETSRALNASLGLSTPTAAETKFPKGMRGGAPK